jgi:hypothetical protein
MSPAPSIAVVAAASVNPTTFGTATLAARTELDIDASNSARASEKSGIHERVRNFIGCSQW